MCMYVISREKLADYVAASVHFVHQFDTFIMLSCVFFQGVNVENAMLQS